MAEVTDRPVVDISPKTNTFLVTIMLTDIKKKTVQEIVGMIQEKIDLEFGHEVGDSFIVMSHVRGGIMSYPVEGKPPAPELADEWRQ